MSNPLAHISEDYQMQAWCKTSQLNKFTCGGHLNYIIRILQNKI